MDNENQDNTEEVKDGKFEIAPMEAITRAEIDVTISTARQYPRKLSEFFKRAEAMVTCDQETAESCFYQLKRKDRTSPTGYKIIEGESIRMAEIVAANFGNLRSAVHIVGHTLTRVSVRAVCHDLETNNLVAVEKQAKTTYSDGTPYNEDMAIVATNALVSKALRDAIFRVVPKALIKPLREKAKLVAFGEGEAFKQRRKRALDWATKIRGVPVERVFAALNVKGEEDIAIDHLVLLTGLKNAIMEGDQTVDEAFPPLEAENKPVFEHPSKKTETKQEAKTEPKTEVKTEAPKEKIEPKPEPKAEPKPEPKQEAKPEAKQEAEAPETTQNEKIVEFPPPDAPEEKPEPPKPKAKATELSEGQKLMKSAFEKAGISFDDFVNCFKSTMFKAKPIPVDFSQIDDKTAQYLGSASKGIASGIKDWKAKGSKK